MLMGNFGLEDEDDHPDDGGLLVISNLPMTWTHRTLAHQILDLLKFGISFYALYLVFLGGRSKAKRFNDRTIEPNKSLIVAFSKTALINRAVFNFCSLVPTGLSKLSVDRAFCTPKILF
jgi:hypothetical protein